jgi:hypothetical protein
MDKVRLFFYLIKHYKVKKAHSGQSKLLPVALDGGGTASFTPRTLYSGGTTFDAH